MTLSEDIAERTDQERPQFLMGRVQTIDTAGPDNDLYQVNGDDMISVVPGLTIGNLVVYWSDGQHSVIIGTPVNT